MAEFDESDGVSNEEKLQIAQHFLLSSPPGQFHEVLADVRKLLPEGLFEDPLAAGMARAYNTRTFKTVTSPSGNKVVLCTAGEVDPTHYFNSKSKKVFAIDHLTLVAADDSSLDFSYDTSKERERSSLQSALDSYVSEKYLCEDAAAGAFIQGGKILAVVTGERPNLRNFWSGKWTSTWSISFNGKDATMDGDIKVHAHYFEDGNVQLQTSKQLQGIKVTYSNETEFASKVVAAIQLAESNVQGGLEEMYSNMAEETFRAMRRIMPVKRTKMEWNINSVRMNRQVRK